MLTDKDPCESLHDKIRDRSEVLPELSKALKDLSSFIGNPPVHEETIPGGQPLGKAITTPNPKAWKLNSFHKHYLRQGRRRMLECSDSLPPISQTTEKKQRSKLAS
jgi:hypothetical protein